MIDCTIIIPAYNNSGLTRQCLDALFATIPARTKCEVIVVDDGSTDDSKEAFGAYGEHVHTERLSTNRGFATACNAGAARARGKYLIFLNNDTRPRPGWLAALMRYADDHPEAALIGSKLVFPDGTIQHAGVAIGQDRYPRHIYAGFPADHPAVNTSRRFAIVTAACACIRREVFETSGGFDTAFFNGYEDVDLCLRLGTLGYEVHYCHESVLDHLESATRDDAPEQDGANRSIYVERWMAHVVPDEIAYYLEDGLLDLRHTGIYPLRFAVSPLLAVLDQPRRSEDVEELLIARSRQVLTLLKETVRLSVRIATLEAGAAVNEQEEGQGRVRELLRARDALQQHIDTVHANDEVSAEAWVARAVQAVTALSLRAGDSARVPRVHEALLRQDEEIQTSILAYQGKIASQIAERKGKVANPFTPSKHLLYQESVRQIREQINSVVPLGATVIVVSKGDDALTQLPGRTGWHFPQTDSGIYAGYHPADSAAAIAHLEALRAKGGQYFLLPATAFWWLDHYRELRDYLDDQCTLIHAHESTCKVFALERSAPATSTTTIADVSQRTSIEQQLQALMQSLLPSSASVILIEDRDGYHLDLPGKQTHILSLIEDADMSGTTWANETTLHTRLDELRSHGAEFLVLPRALCLRHPAASEFDHHLSRTYRRVAHQEHLCTVYSLGNVNKRKDRKGPALTIATGVQVGGPE